MKHQRAINYVEMLKSMHLDNKFINFVEKLIDLSDVLTDVEVCDNAFGVALSFNFPIADSYIHMVIKYNYNINNLSIGATYGAPDAVKFRDKFKIVGYSTNCIFKGCLTTNEKPNIMDGFRFIDTYRPIYSELGLLDMFKDYFKNNFPNHEMITIVEITPSVENE